MNFIKNFNGLELLFIVILAILVFGPEKIPEIAAKLGSWTRALRRIANQIMEDINKETGLSDLDFDLNQDQISSSLNQTTTKMKNTVQTIQSPVNSFKDSLQDQVMGESTGKPEPEKQIDSKNQPISDLQETELENKLKNLEQELQTLRSELNRVRSEEPEDGDG